MVPAARCTRASGASIVWFEDRLLPVAPCGPTSYARDQSSDWRYRAAPHRAGDQEVSAGRASVFYLVPRAAAERDAPHILCLHPREELRADVERPEELDGVQLAGHDEEEVRILVNLALYERVRGPNQKSKGSNIRFC